VSFVHLSSPDETPEPIPTDYALTTTHNLISTMLDAHLSQGNDLSVEVNDVAWQRSLDMNDCALRKTVVGLAGKTGGTPRKDGFKLTAASELMAVLCLADGLAANACALTRGRPRGAEKMNRAHCDSVNERTVQFSRGNRSCPQPARNAV
jgi:hypothetical protein